MKIEKFKKLASGKYKVTFGTNKTIDLYEEVILKYNLLAKPEITSNLLLEITSDNEYYDVYYSGLKMIKTRPRSKKEVRDALVKKEYNKSFIDQVIDTLQKQKYLDDGWYAKAYVSNGVISSKGYYKLKNELEKKGVAKEDIMIALEDYTEEKELEILKKKIRTMINRNHSKSNVVLQKKIVVDLVSNGFHKEIIMKVLESQELKDDSLIMKKEYEKIYTKLSKKYSGKEFELKLKQKLYQKGIYYTEED